MTDLEGILPLWSELEATGAEYVLASVVAVEGSSYRKPGALMLLAQDGRRAGTVSGGCLEAEVARRAWWLTANGPVVERYSTAADDGERPYGSGCGGAVHLLLERRQTAGPLFIALAEAFRRRIALSVATVLEGPAIGSRAIAGLSSAQPDSVLNDSALLRLAQQSLQQKASIAQPVIAAGVESRAWADYRAARPGLWVFGAGDDARPLVRLARELGWFVAVADGRRNLATQARFPAADSVVVLPMEDQPESLAGLREAASGILSRDMAVAMTHSFDQDARMLAVLLSLEFDLAYIGVLGPRLRTRELLLEAAALLGVGDREARVEAWLGKVHAPTGLDLGAATPASIALSILAEAQQALTSATGLPLSQVRGDLPAPRP